MNSTLNYYNDHAQEYFESTVNADMSECRNRFLKYLTPGSYILDAGCGSGRDSKFFLSEGYRVKAIDGSEEMCKFASQYLSQEVECLDFKELEFHNQFDGIWACASLLHVNKNDIQDVINRLHSALKEGGTLYASFKVGNGERTENGKYYNDLTKDDITRLFKDYETLELWCSDDVRKNISNKWINIIAKTVWEQRE